MSEKRWMFVVATLILIVIGIGRVAYNENKATKPEEIIKSALVINKAYLPKDNVAIPVVAGKGVAVLVPVERGERWFIEAKVDGEVMGHNVAGIIKFNVSKEIYESISVGQEVRLKYAVKRFKRFWGDQFVLQPGAELVVF
ncbi:MAG: hypothetical protein Q7S12_04180 [bacterium]|nr:hypothetical protein [bacterium]